MRWFCYALCFVGLNFLEIWAGANALEPRGEVDAVVVFGAAVWQRDRPSHALWDRVQTGVDVFMETGAEKLVMSGGPSQYRAHEADVMRRLALDQGILQSQIVLDRGGVNTWATVRNLDPEKRYVMVSNDFHLARIAFFADRLGVEVVGTVPAKYHFGRYAKNSYFVVREGLGLMAYRWLVF